MKLLRLLPGALVGGGIAVLVGVGVTLAGPSLGTLASVDKRFARTASRLAELVVPADGKAMHALVTSAVQMAAHAVRLRRTAIDSGNMQQALDASAAAAGALLMFDRARQDVGRIALPPQLP